MTGPGRVLHMASATEAPTMRILPKRLRVSTAATCGAEPHGVL